MQIAAFSVCFHKRCDWFPTKALTVAKLWVVKQSVERTGATHSYRLSVLSVAAMSSYLYIVKSELPLVIQAFLKADASSE